MNNMSKCKSGSICKNIGAVLEETEGFFRLLFFMVTSRRLVVIPHKELINHSVVCKLLLKQQFCNMVDDYQCISLKL